MERVRHNIQKIAKGKMTRLMKGYVLPALPDEWTLFNGELIYRRRDVLMQTVMVNRSRHLPSFRVNYAINVIALAGVPEVANLGSALLAKPRGVMHKERRVLWLEWSDDTVSLANTVLTELRRQASPSLIADLNLEEAAAYVERYCLSNANFYEHLSLGVMDGLLAKWDDGARQLDVADKLLTKHLKSFEKHGETAPSWIQQDLQSITEYRNRFGNTAELWEYCKDRSSQRLREWGTA